MRRRRNPEPPESHERWLVSYADFITLLFAFFTTLYAISVVDAEKAERLVQSIRESFGPNVYDFGSPSPGLFPDQASKAARLGDEAGPGSPIEAEDARLDLLGRRVRDLEAQPELAGAVRVRRSEAGLVISLADSFLFQSGRAALSPRARKTLQELASLLTAVPNHVRAEGHSDDRPLRSTGFRTNWHLSAARAVAVVVELQRAGVAGYRLSASGFAGERPLVSNGTAEGRRMNRRVELVVLRARMGENDT
jgi:chemotaxis protein MotB